MMGRPSFHHNWILKHTAFQAGSDLRPRTKPLPRQWRMWLVSLADQNVVIL